MSKNVTRLFAQFAPSNYNLSIKLSEDKKSFTGSVTIRGRRNGRPSERLTLHQKGLKISQASITKIEKDGSEKALEIERQVSHKSYDEIRLHTKTTLYPGEYVISLDFSGLVTRNMDGIYPCFYEQDGEKRQLIATQFESHHAREVFPCIDEPEAKATFDLQLTHHRDEVALGNTSITKEVIDGTLKTTSFETTPVMSTYLLAFVVGNLHYKEATSKNGVKIRTYATADQVKHTDFALDNAVKCMDFYEDYYDIPFPISKCDFVALPDFSSGAMENWGLITFREQTLLMDPENTSLGMKQYVAIVVAHELTHQWFGNLVTMRWWTDLWLNEGFASWMEFLAIDHYYPEWDLWTQFAVDEQQAALKADSLEHTHPVEVEVKHPDEIRTIFDIISYQKGASMIHMLHDYLEAEPFRDGLRHYLKTHSYKNTDTVDLWQALEDVTKKPVKEFMGAWTSQSGFPILDVEVKNDHLKITQRRFVANPTSAARDDKTLWPVPLLTPGLEKSTIDKKTSNVVMTGNVVPLKLNVGQNGFYRVNYPDEMQQKQIKAIDSDQLSDIDRMSLLADAFETTKAGYQSVDSFLDFLAHFKNESSLSVWEIIASSVGAIRSTLSSSDNDDQLRELMKPYVRELTKPQLARLGWEQKDNEPHLDTLLRPIIISLATGADNEECLATAASLYHLKIDKQQHINPDLRGIVYSTAARKGGKKEFDEMLSLYKKSTSSEEKLSLTAGLTSFEQSDVHTEVLKVIKSDAVRLQDTFYWIAYSLMNRHSRAVTWQWLKENWQWLKKNLGTDLSFSRMPLYVARNIADKKLLEDYEQFFTENMEPLLKRTYNQGIEVAETMSAWRERDAKIALNWFKH